MLSALRALVGSTVGLFLDIFPDLLDGFLEGFLEFDVVDALDPILISESESESIVYRARAVHAR